MKPTRYPKIPCRHCGKPVASRKRGLCWRCSGTPEISDLYPAQPPGPHYEPSAEEVERIVAEQMRRLPKWWNQESRREYEYERRETA